MPLFEERYQVLTEAGRVMCEVHVSMNVLAKALLQKFNGTVTNLVEQCARSASKLVDLVVSNVASYRDIVTYNGAKGETSDRCTSVLKCLHIHSRFLQTRSNPRG